MHDEEYGRLLVDAIKPINREYYADKVKYWLIKSKLGTDRNADMLTSKIFDESTPVINTNICKGRLANGTKCSKPAKYNGYCGFHKTQYKPSVSVNRVNNNRINRPRNLPTLL